MNTGLAILWCAARAVPRRQRAEWLAEWTAEFWYIRQQGAPTVSFCWGAFRDAWWLRRNHPRALRLEMPLECLGWLGLIAAACALLVLAIPGARRVLLPFPYDGVENLVLLSPVREEPLSSYPPYAMPAVVFICLLVAAATTSARFRGCLEDLHYRRWMFLGAKIVLLVFIGFFLILILQALIGFEIRPLVMPLYVIAFRWALIDQQRRCPECLRRLLLPVRIGAPSQTFLEWYGTEFLCGNGHGLLQVPETPTASFERQRWLHLDDSWTASPHHV